MGCVRPLCSGDPEADVNLRSCIPADAAYLKQMSIISRRSCRRAPRRRGCGLLAARLPRPPACCCALLLCMGPLMLAPAHSPPQSEMECVSAHARCVRCARCVWRPRPATRPALRKAGTAGTCTCFLAHACSSGLECRVHAHKVGRGVTHKQQGRGCISESVAPRAVCVCVCASVCTNACMVPFPDTHQESEPECIQVPFPDTHQESEPECIQVPLPDTHREALQCRLPNAKVMGCAQCQGDGMCPMPR